MEINELVTGKIIGKILNLGLAGFICFYTASTLREFVEMIKVYNLPYTPISLVIATFLIVVCIISYYGFEGLARISALTFILIMLSLVALLLMAIPLYDINYLKPALGYGIRHTVINGIMRSSAYTEVTLLAIFANNLQGVRHVKKVGMISIIIAGITFSLTIAFYTAAYGYRRGPDNLSGLFELSRSIFFNRFIQRVESIFLFMWIISSLIAVGAAFYSINKIYASTFKIKNEKPLIIPIAIITFVLTIMPKNISELLDINLAFIRQYSMIFVFGAQILILILSVIFKKKGDVKNAKKC